jgi:2,4-diaminopentanoate dehydrogenase
VTGAVEVAMVGLGPMGCRIAAALLERPGVRVAGAADVSPERAGHDLGALLETGPRGLRVAGSIDDLPAPAPGAVALLCTTSSLAAAIPQVEALLDGGWNVLSTCEELSFPGRETPGARRLDEAARQAGRSVLASGINPGFLLDTLPLTLAAACVRVDHVLVRRVLDTDRRRLPLQRKVGVGMAAAEFRALAASGGLGHVGLRQSAGMLAAGLGWRLDGYDEELEPVLADRPRETGVGPVAAGAVIGQHQVARGRAGGREVLRYVLEMYAGAEAFDEVAISGEPNLRSRIEGGLNGDAGTVGVIANLVPVVAAAEPGLLTMLDVVRLRASGSGGPGA